MRRKKTAVFRGADSENQFSVVDAKQQIISSIQGVSRKISAIRMPEKQIKSEISLLLRSPENII